MIFYKLIAEKFKEFKNTNEKKAKKTYNKCNVSSNYDEKYGFQLTNSDLGDYLNNFLNHEQKKTFLDSINFNGYLSLENGLLLKELLADKDYDLYIKSIYSGDIDSFFSEGVRCLNNTSSLNQINPKSIEDVKFDASVSLIQKDAFSVLIHSIKNNYGFSQGYNFIDGTLILRFPKGFSKDDILYFNESSNTINIDPKYIVGFIQVDENHNVMDFTYINNIANKENKLK